MNFGKSIREITFGVSDGLVSILGLVVGVASASVPNKFVILAGVAGMIAAAISMSSGVYLANKSQREYLRNKIKKKKLLKRIFTESPVHDGLIIGAAFIIAGWIPIIPFFFISGIKAITFSFLLTTLALFLFGAYKAKYTGRNMINSGVEMLVVSLISAGLGFLVGHLFKFWFGV